MTYPLIDRRDLDFFLFDWLGVADAAGGAEGAGRVREDFEAVLDLSDKLAHQHFLSHYKASDVNEPRLQDGEVRLVDGVREALTAYAELGLFAAGFPEDRGGMGLPYSVCLASQASFAAANVATTAYPMLTAANARLILAFGSERQKEVFALPQVQGRWFGTMCMSEPQAGSNLADLKTRATPCGEDELGARFHIVGNKMWISGGDQNVSENIIHLVLAKIPQEDGSPPPGTKGLSLFIVPKVLPDGRKNDISVAGLNHKMGYRGTSNCALNFGESGGAVGWLIGRPGDGLKQMFLMMNEARIGVGLGAAALGYRGAQHSVRYATERVQGRLAGAQGGDQVPIIMHADVRRMLMAQKAYSEGALALCLFCGDLVDRQADPETAALLALLTPVVKTWTSEYAILSNDLAIQIHGGYGYTRDFDVEQLYRDNRLNQIHEGTTGIQALDLINRHVLRGNEAGWDSLDRHIGRVIDRAGPFQPLHAHQRRLSAAWAGLRDAARMISQLPAPRAIAGATPFLWAFGHLVMACLWLDLAAVALERLDAEPGMDGSARDFLEGKVFACDYMFRAEAPKVEPWLALAASPDRAPWDVPASAFTA